MGIQVNEVQVDYHQHSKHHTSALTTLARLDDTIVPQFVLRYITALSNAVAIPSIATSLRGHSLWGTIKWVKHVRRSRASKSHTIAVTWCRDCRNSITQSCLLVILARITCVQAGRKPCAQDGRAHLSVPPARSAILTLGKNENFQRLSCCTPIIKST